MVDDGVAIGPNAILTRHFIISHAARRQFVADYDPAAVAIGVNVFVNDIFTEARLLVDAKQAGDAPRDAADDAADQPADWPGGMRALFGSLPDAAGYALGLSLSERANYEKGAENQGSFHKCAPRLWMMSA